MKVPGLNPNDVYVTTFVFYILKTINKSTFLCRFNVIVNIITTVAPIFFQIELQGYFPLANYYSFRTFFKTLMLIQSFGKCYLHYCIGEVDEGKSAIADVCILHIDMAADKRTNHLFSACLHIKCRNLLRRMGTFE